VVGVEITAFHSPDDAESRKALARLLLEAVTPLMGTPSSGGYGTAEIAPSGVDLSHLRRNLRLTPTERVEQMVAFVRFVLPLRGALRRDRD
jgi:hypothetical protein